MMGKFEMALTLLSFCVMRSMAMDLPESVDFDWEDFDKAIKEEDCFGDHCDGESAALFMMQRGFNRKMLQEELGHIQEAKAVGDLSMEDLADAITSEDGDATHGLALVQTSASVERASVVSDDAHVAVDAEGNLEANPEKHTLPASGVMQMSVDDHGHFHWEAAAPSVSLLQTEHRVAEKVPVTPSELNDYEETEGVSMMQTEMHKSGGANTMSIVANADGTVEEMASDVIPSDGMMHISVDENGHFHSEEGFMLMQTKTDIDSSESEDTEATQEESHSEKAETEEEWDPSIIGSTVPGHPSWKYEAMPNVDALSLLQTEMNVVNIPSSHQYAVAETDGTIDNKPTFTKGFTHDVMHMSVDANGHFHMEM